MRHTKITGRSNTRKRQEGFNLLELMFALAIAGILIGIGVPSMTTMVQNARMTTQANDFLSSLKGARAKALENNTQVTLCKSDDGAACTADGTWAAGWIIFADIDANSARDAGTEELLLVHEALSGSNTLVSVAFDDSIGFAPNGMAVGSTANSGTFRLLDSRGVDKGRDIGVSRIGGSCVAHAGDDC
jgi:type IV fimbrial biogenesis protein FimT